MRKDKATRLRVQFGRNNELTAAQRRMYSMEKQMNFRTISRLCATRSPYTLTSSDLASIDLHTEIAQIGQFAELVYSKVDPKYVFNNLDMLSRSHFPLEGYDALPGTTLISSFHGDTAQLPVFVAYRPTGQQLIVAIRGTATLHQALLDLSFAKKPHPLRKDAAVHAGFWKLYQGCKTQIVEAVREGLKRYTVGELVITGHSMGGAVGSLLALDVLTSEEMLELSTISLNIVGFGSPRAGNSQLVQLWRDAVKKRRMERGEESVKEYLVKGFKDGVPALPPAYLGYRHFCEHPLYFYHGKLFHIPESENEHGIFDVSKEALDANQPLAYPRGGHNYYNGRDLEKLGRRMQWVEDLMARGNEWESKYLEKVNKNENIEER